MFYIALLPRVVLLVPLLIGTLLVAPIKVASTQLKLILAIAVYVLPAIVFIAL